MLTFSKIKDILGEGSGEEEESDYEEYDTIGSPSASSQDFILGQVPHVEDLSMLHPPINHIRTYWHTYLENCESFLRLLHTPTMTIIVHEAINNSLNLLARSDELLLFCIYFAATSSVTEQECLQLFGYEKEALLQKYQIGIKHALARARFMHSQDLKVLQGLVLYLVCDCLFESD